MFAEHLVTVLTGQIDRQQAFKCSICSIRRDKFWLLFSVQTQLVRGITIYHTEGEVIVSDLDVRCQNHFDSNQTPQII